MGPPHSPIFGTYGGHFCGRSETRFNGIGGPKLGPPKTQIETQNWCQFLSPSFDTICLPRDAISKYINQSSVPGWNSFNFFGSEFFLFVRAALVIIKPNCWQNVAPKMGPPHSPIFGTYGGHFCGRSETRFNGIGGQNWVPQKHKLRPKIGANFWAPLLTPFAYRVMLFQNILINPACEAETVFSQG